MLISLQILPQLLKQDVFVNAAQEVLLRGHMHLERLQQHTCRFVTEAVHPSYCIPGNTEAELGLAELAVLLSWQGCSTSQVWLHVSV